LIDHSQAFAHATHWLRAKEARAQQQRPRNVRPGARVSQQEYLSNMVAIQDLARQHGASVIVIAAPYRDNDPNAPEADLMLQYRVALGTTMRQRGVPFVELRELTPEAYPSNEGWFGERIHPNHMGHRLIASEVLKGISATHALKELKIPELVP
jgi:lysophospholipase L1-like esterase